MENKSFYQLEVAENLGTLPQCYASFNLMFFLRGSATAMVGGKLTQLHPHDFIFFNMYEIHQFLSLDPGTRCLLVMIREDYLRTAVPEILPCSFSSHAICSDNNKEHYEYFCREFGRFIYHHTVHESGNQLQCLSHLGNLLVYIMANMAIKTTANSIPQTDDRMYQILTYLSENYTAELSLSLVAQHAGVHPQYFSRYFKEHMGIGLTEYINQLRIVNSLSEVLNSDAPLLDIALRYGYNNYKTYSIAFKKIFHTTPTDMRSRQKYHNKELLEEETASVFSFFRKYWSADSDHQQISINKHNNQITLELDGTSAGISQRHLLDLPEFCYSIGRAAELLRGDIQEQLKSAAKDLPIHQLRLRNIFSDDLFVYYETPEKNAVYNWQYIDMIYDFLSELQIKPYTELGFMPRLLSSKQQFANWQHRPNISFPRSLKNWSRLVESFLRHLIARYGEEEVLTWKFNMWTSPDLDMKGGYWHESMESFFLFYRVTYNAVKSVNESLLFAGPDFSIPNGLTWYQAFFDYCRQYELRPDFLTVHMYAEPFNSSDRMLRGRYLSTSGIPAYTQQLSPYQAFFDFLHIVNQDKSFQGSPIVISDWNNTYHAKDYARDTCFMSSFIAYTFQMLAGTQVKTLGFRSLCDVNEDFFPENRLFCGGPGLIDVHGIKKASYYSFQLLNRLGSKILAKGEHYLFAKSGSNYKLLLFHMVFPAETDEKLPSLLSYEQRYDCYGSIPPLSVCAVLRLDPAQYLLRRTSIDRNSGSAYDLWNQIGAPPYETVEIVNRIKEKAIPDVYYSEAAVKERLIINVDLSPHSVVLIEIMRTS